MPNQLMIYGATGYTGKLIARLAKARGLQPILAGRNRAKLKAVAEPLGFAYRVVRLDLAQWLAEALRDIDVVLNLAGPFVTTARPMVAACLQTGTHYLDVTGEFPIFAALHGLDAQARAQHIMLLPGVGNCVVPSDCLAAYIVQRLPDAASLKIGLSRAELVSQGSVKTVIALLAHQQSTSETQVTVVRRGVFTTVPLCSVEHSFFDGHREHLCTALSWGDVFTTFQTTQIPNIAIYLAVNRRERVLFDLVRRNMSFLTTSAGQLWLRALTNLLPEGPSDTQRMQASRVVMAEAENATGQQVRVCLRTPEAYTFTAMAALAIVKRVLAGEYTPGFRTPAQAYGADFILGFDGVTRTELPVSGSTYAV